MQNAVKFAGDQKVGKSLLYDLEMKFVERTIHLIPKGLETYHLTMLTLVWSGLIVYFGYLAKGNINWFHLVSAMVFLQYLTDLFDGKVGKMRNTGLIKWGFYMDHFLDYLFLGSILTAYAFQIPSDLRAVGFITALFVIGFLINSFLAFAATNQFEISFIGVGPTEGRILFILVNTFIIIFGFKYFLLLLPYIAILAFLALCAVVWRKHKQIWKMDTENKNKC